MIAQIKCRFQFVCGPVRVGYRVRVDPWRGVADMNQTIMAATAIRFPATLEGLHAVGCVDLMHRDLLVRLFYPTVESDTRTDSRRYCPWLPSPIYARRYIDFVSTVMPGIAPPPMDSLVNPVIRAFYNAPLKTCTHQSVSSAMGLQPVLKGYPVAVLSHGLGTNRCMYSATSIDLASRGYVVASVEHRDESASSSLRRIPGPGVLSGCFDRYIDDWIPVNTDCGVGQNERNIPKRRSQVKIRRKDVSDALDLLLTLNSGRPVDNMTVENYDYSQFKNALDTQLCFVIGHSFGGGTVVQTLHEDKRFKCGIALDPNMIPVHDEVYENGLDQPVLFVNSELGYQWQTNINNIVRLTKPINEKGISETPVLTVRGTTHSSYYDLTHAVPGYGDNLMDINQSHGLVMDTISAFLNRFLLKDENHQSHVPNLDGGKNKSEDIILRPVLKGSL